jgi:2-(1,2-epoxy-1,2-dihydrophenyl)acetyl-CoA isomerase
MTEPSTILHTVHNGVATLTLNRPDVFNALNAQLFDELMAALRHVDRDPNVRCVVITGTGKAFCSGQDLREIPLDGGAPAMIGERLRTRYNPLVLKLRSLGKPVIAAVNGVAAGAGLSLALACDLRIAAAEARFSAAFVKIALIPDCGMTYFLPRLVGPGRAMRLALTGEAIDADTALAWGLVEEVAPADGFAAAVDALTTILANGPALAQNLIKRSLIHAGGATLEQMLEYEAQAQPLAGAHPDFHEGVAAFRAKRPAAFQ